MVAKKTPAPTAKSTKAAPSPAATIFEKLRKLDEERAQLEKSRQSLLESPSECERQIEGGKIETRFDETVSDPNQQEVRVCFAAAMEIKFGAAMKNVGRFNRRVDLAKKLAAKRGFALPSGAVEDANG
jgi:hypothetical protein